LQYLLNLLTYKGRDFEFLEKTCTLDHLSEVVSQHRNLDAHLLQA
jgi:hypothetical protein